MYKILVALILCSLSVHISSKNIYLASTGNDNNDGQTRENAVKTLSMALTIAEHDDVISVLDFIDITQEPNKPGSTSNNDVNPNGTSSYVVDGLTYKTWNIKGNNGIKMLDKTIAITGENKETSGFDGKDQTRLLRIDGFGRTITFRNLTFKNGNSIPNGDSGAGVYIRSTNPVFENCNFIDNRSDQAGNNDMRRGGACFVLSNAKFNDCYFSGNLSREGSAMYISYGIVELNGCVFENHDNSHIMYADGGTLYVTKEGDIDNINLTMKNCVIRDSKTYRAGGAMYICDRTPNMSHKVYVESTAFIDNTSLADGGAVALNNDKEGSTLDVTFVNSTFFGNQAKQGGTFFYNKGRVGSELNFINCTITQNKIMGDNMGLGPGFRFHCETNSGEGDITTKNVIKRFYNTIIENNYVTADPSNGSDMSFRGHTPENGVDFFMFNSFLGKMVAKTNYIPVNANQNFFGYQTDELAGLASPASTYVQSQNSIPLYTSAAGYRHGNAKYLRDLNVNTDQLGNLRPFADDRCAVGAIEIPVQAQGSGDPYIYQHIIMSGQSLSTGHQGYPAISTENVEGNYMLGSQLWANYGNSQKNSFNPLVANIAAHFRNGDNVMSRSAGTIAESPLFGAVNHIQKKKSDSNRILATSCGYSGTSIEELSKESQIRTYYNDFIYSLIYGSKVARNTNSTISCPVIFWMQGEFNYSEYADKGLTADGPNTTNREEYKTLLLQLKNNMQSDVLNNYGQQEAPILITYQTGAQYTRGKTLEIGMAQLEASNENEDIICAGPVYQMTDRGGHLDPNGYRWYGEMLGKVYYKTQVLGEDFKPLQPKAISRGSQSNQVIIKFHVPELPLVLDVQTLPEISNYGFDVYLNGAKQTISNVSIDDDNVILTCQNALNGTIEITYAGTDASDATRKQNGHGNLRDSDSYQAYYNYIDLDKKNADDSYFYPRESFETTLRPDFEPNDNEGIIYDKPYPLYNFSVGFYYQLENGTDTYIVPAFKGDFPVSMEEQNENTAELKLSQKNNSIIVENSTSGTITVNVYNMAGTQIKSITDSFGANDKKEYSLQDFAAGVYVVRVATGSESATSKIVIR